MTYFIYNKSGKRGLRRLNTSIVLAAVHGLSGLFRAVSAVEPSLFRLLLPPPLPTPLSPSLISHLASVDVKQNVLDRIRAQELCESRGGRPGLPSLINVRFLWT